jgi:hypothetical protein
MMKAILRKESELGRNGDWNTRKANWILRSVEKLRTQIVVISAPLDDWHLELAGRHCYDPSLNILSLEVLKVEKVKSLNRPRILLLFKDLS